MDAPQDTVNPISDPHGSSSSFSSAASSPSYPPVAAQNISSLVPVKLSQENYLLWKELFLPVLQSYDMLSIIDGSEPCPPQYLTTQEDSLTSTTNPAFVQWIKRDRHCKIWINSSLYENILLYTVGSSTSRELWLTLEKRFSATTRSHLLQLKAKIQNPKKGSLSMVEYLQLVKDTAISLAAAGSPLDDIDFVAHVLSGLPSDYDSFATSIRVWSEPITSDELHALLLSEEIALSSRLSSFSKPTTHVFQTSLSSQPQISKTNSNNRYSNQARPFSNSSHPNPNPNSRNPQQPFRFSKPQHTSHHNPNHNPITPTIILTPLDHFFRPKNYSTPRIVCQICNKPGHGAPHEKIVLTAPIKATFPLPTFHPLTPQLPFTHLPHTPPQTHLPLLLGMLILEPQITSLMTSTTSLFILHTLVQRKSMLPTVTA